MPTGLEEGAAVLAFVGLGFRCLAGCIEGFHLISNALRLGRQATYFRCAIILEEQRLLLWAKRSGLTSGTLDRRLNEALVNETLATLQELLLSTDNLSKKYGLNLQFNNSPSESPAPSQGHNSLSGDDLDFLLSDNLREERKRAQERAGAIQSRFGIHKKFWFAAVDRVKFAELLEEVGHLIQRLNDLLNDHVQEEVKDAVKLQRVHSIGLATSLEELKSMVEALTLRHMESQPETTAALLKIITILEKDTVPEGSQPGELQQILSKAPSGLHSSLRPVFSDRLAEMKLLTPNSLNGTIKYDGHPYFVEWKRYDWPDSETAKKKTLDSIANLALLLNSPKHPSFRTLSCYGILAEERSHRYSFLFTWPPNREDHTVPKSLQQYMSTSYKPSLTERIQLARELATSLFFLHAAHWLHKAFSSRNVIFFPKSASAPRSLEEPFIVGFEYSRPDADDEPSEKLERNPEADIYRHPDLLAPGSISFHRRFDIYSFGLVLLEIAKWRPLKEIFLRSAVEKHCLLAGTSEKSLTKEQLRRLETQLLESCRLEDVNCMRESLLNSSSKDSHPGDLAFRAGSRVLDIILTCVGGYFDQYSGSRDGGEELQDAFFTKVVKALESCVI